jgi:hypothetical protein
MYNIVDKNFDHSLREILKYRLGKNNNGKEKIAKITVKK